MAENRSKQDADKFIVRMPDGMRDRISALAKRNGRTSTAEIVLAIENWLSLAEQGRETAETMRTDVPDPAKAARVYLLQVDAAGVVTKRTLISELEHVEEEIGIRANDFRIITITPGDEARDPVKARMAADVRRSREIVEAREREKGNAK